MDTAEPSILSLPGAPVVNNVLEQAIATGWTNLESPGGTHG